MRTGHRAAAAVVGLFVLTGITVAMVAPGGDDWDEAGFREYVQTYVGLDTDSIDPGRPARDRQWTRAHPELVMQEGNRACAWLSSRPAAPRLAPDESWTSGAVLDEYEPSNPLPKGLSVNGRSYLAAGAWTHLCSEEHKKRTSPTEAQLKD